MTTAATLLLAAVLLASVAGRLVAPRRVERLVPSWVPAPRLAVLASGVADLLAAVLLLVPDTRALGGWVTAALVLAYLPAHLEPLRRPPGQETTGFDGRPAVAVRVLVNLVYIAAGVLVGVSA